MVVLYKSVCKMHLKMSVNIYKSDEYIKIFKICPESKPNFIVFLGVYKKEK